MGYRSRNLGLIVKISMVIFIIAPFYTMILIRGGQIKPDAEHQETVWIQSVTRAHFSFTRTDAMKFQIAMGTIISCLVIAIVSFQAELRARTPEE
jgi:hypothetical protein